MSAYQKFLRIGNRPHYPIVLNEKLKQTVFMSLLLITIVSLQTLSLLGRGLIKPALVPSSEVLLLGLTFFMVKWGATILPRVIISVAPVVTTFLYTAFFTSPGDDVAAGSFMMLLASASIPFVLFTLHEKFWLLFSLAINVFCIYTVGDARELLFGVIELKDYDAVHTSVSDIVSHITAIVGLYSILYFKELETHKSTIENEKMQEETRRKNEELVNSEQELKNMLVKLEENRKSEQLRGEANEKLSDFSVLLRNRNLDMQEQFEQIISFIVKSVNANQGGLYLVEGDEHEKYMRLKACYAYDRKKYIDQRIEIGEGIVGQVYLEKDYVLMTDVPQDYVRITSGLGDATPASIIVLPMLYHEQVEVIIELASFEPLEEHQVEMLQKMGEALASHVAAYRIQHQTQNLLQRSQQQAEELQAREEELRQNMEELQGTQEDMQRKEQYYIDKIAELESNQKA